ncbi:MAG: cysteine hydrolase family protein [Pseudomonas sp.]|uniref:cysteine hydrolase family protein n=1 Tax=Pseudomonas sp. TaxID=306 RepID=UPI003397851A
MPHTTPVVPRMAPPALLIIDQQQGMLAPHLGPRNNPAAEQRMLDLLGHWRQRHWPLLHVRHISRSATSVFAPGQVGALFQAAFEPGPEEALFEKNVPDAFAQSGLERWLRVRALDQLVIVGVSSENSVESTARSAGNLGFRAFVAEDACYTFAKNDFHGHARSAEEVHAMAMANLHGEYAQVLDCAALLARFAD